MPTHPRFRQFSPADDMPTRGFTGIRNSLLGMLLGLWAVQDGEGFSCDSSTGFTLPDAAWVRKSDVEALTDKEDFLPVVPPFIVEITLQV